MAAWIKMSLGMELGLDLSDFVLDRDPVAPSPKGGRTPKFSANVHCGHTAGWTKMPLGMEVGLGPDDFMLDGHPASPIRRVQPHPIFGPCLLWPNGWMDQVDQDATWYGGRPRPRPHCARWGTQLPEKRAQPPPNIRPMSIVVKRMDGSRCHLVRR